MTHALPFRSRAALRAAFRRPSRYRGILVLACSLVLGACASYTQQTEKIRVAIADRRYDDALKELDESSLAKSKSDEVLFKMEKGSILSLKGDYTKAAQAWSRASDRIEELYTISLGNQAAALALNESYSDYEGESHEKVLLPLMSAVAYFANKEPEKATVEIRRAYLVLEQIKKSFGGKGAFSRDAFAHALSGMIYEARQEWDAAIVEYRNALEAAKANQSWAGDVNVTPIASALGRLAEFRGKKDVLAQLKASHPALAWTKQQDLAKQGEAFIVYEAGRSPIKVAQDIVVPVVDNVVRVSWPVFRPVSSGKYPASVFLDGTFAGRTVVMQDIGALAKQSLEDRRLRDLLRMAARVLAKDQVARAAGRSLGPIAQIATGIAGAVTETADTRSWTSLPDALHVLRVPIPANKKTVLRLDPVGGKSEEWVLTLRPGEKALVRARSF